MRIDELKKVKDRRPFRAFWMHLADGREFQVRHPDAIAWGGEGSRIVTYISPADDWEVIDIALVTSLGNTPASSPAAESKAGDNGA